MSQFFGYKGLIELPTDLQNDPRRGRTYTRLWRGTQQDVLEFGRVLTLEGMRFQIEPPKVGGWWHITAFYSFQDEDPNAPMVDRWTLDGEDLELAVMEVPKTQQLLDAVGPNVLDPLEKTAWRRVWRRMLEAYEAGTESLNFKNPNTAVDETWDVTEKRLMTEILQCPIGPFTTDMQNRMEDLIGTLASGNKVKRILSWVLSRSLVVADEADLQISAENVGKIYTPDQLEAEQQCQSKIKTTLPQNGSWLKCAPIQTDLDNGKVQITLKWIWAEHWAPYLYDKIL